MINKFIFLSLVFSVCLISKACEDDVILDPNNGSDEEKGSYGSLRIPELEDDSKVKNPEIF